ncbi:DUF1186 domain-containing protein [Methylocystis sp. S23]
MEPSDIVAALIDNDGVLPVDALRAAAARRSEVAPLLIAEIERAAQAPAGELATFHSVFFGWFLLAEWRETAAYRPVLRLLRRPHDDLEKFFGDAITEAAQRVIISLFDGDPQPLFDFALDKEADPYARDAAFGALAALAVDGKFPRERLAQFLRDCFDRLEPRDDSEESYVWVGWSEAVAALGLVDMVPLAREAFAKGWIDEGLMGFEDFEADLAHAVANPESPFHSFSGANEPWDDTIAELSEWHYYSEAGRLERESENQGASSALDGLDWNAVTQGTHFNPFKDVGRNDPCPCGSGKKYKKCCLA